MFYIPFLVIYRKNDNFKEIICASTIWLLSVKLIEPMNFKIEDLSQPFCRLFVHTSFYVILLFVFKFIFYLIKNHNDNFVKKWLILSLIYFGINLIVLVLIWPGNFIWDEKSIFYCAQRFIYSGWQSYLSVLFYSWSLLIIPFVIGIQIVEIIIISLIVGYILSKLDTMYKSKYLIIFMILLLSLPPIIMNNLYPLRHAIYCYIELLFLSKIFFIKKENSKIELSDLYLFSFCIVILSFWRTEGIYYLLLGPITLIIIFKKYIFNKKMILSLIGSLIVFLVMYMPFNILNKQNKNNYVLTMFINPLSIMFQDDLNISEADYNNINAVFNIDILKQYPSYKECPSFYEGVVTSDYDKHMKKFIVSYAKVILKNPGSFINARMKTFLATTALDNTTAANSPWDMYEHIEDIKDEEIKNILYNDVLSEPINSSFRNKIIKFFKGVYSKSYTYNLFGKIIWNFLPHLFVMLFLLIYYLFKKNFNYAILLLLPLIKAFLVFCTAPATYFFYYFSIYLIGVIVIGLLSYNLYLKKIKKKGN